VLPDGGDSGRPRRQRPERGSMRTAKASSAANPMGHSATKMMTPFIIGERKCKLHDPPRLCTRHDRRKKRAKKARREAGLTGVRRISAKDRFTMRQNQI